jgi:hypothetical protein
LNLDKLFSWIAGIVIACAAFGQLDTLQNWIWKSQAKMIYESRSSNWGSPRFFNEPTVKGTNSSKHQNTH